MPMTLERSAMAICLAPALLAAVAAQPKGAQRRSGEPREMSLFTGPARVRIRSESQPLLLQDNRVYSGGDLEVRIGKQSGQGRVWPAGQTETIAFTLDLGEPVT